MSRADRRFLRLMSKIEKARSKRRKPPRVPTLTERQRTFVRAFIWETHGNATAAARLAGFAWPSKQGPALLDHPLVGGAIHSQVGLMAASHLGPLRAGLLTFQ